MKSLHIGRLASALLCATALGCGGGSGGDSGGGPNPTPEPRPTPGPVPEPDPGPDPLPQAGWVAQNAGSPDFYSVSAFDADHAFVLASIGLLMRTDNGSTWSEVGEVSPGADRQIRFFDANHGWAISVALVMSTSDGGATWTTRLTLPAGGISFNSMSFINASTGWVTTSSNDLLKTTDGGATWSAQKTPPGSFPLVAFADGQNGWMVLNNSSAKFLRTLDGGATWEHLFSAPSGLFIHDLATTGAETAWGVGTSQVVGTTDGGATSTVRELFDESKLVGVHFVDAQVGWVVGDRIHHTTDGGATWTVQPTPQTGFWDVTFVNATTGWAVGANGVLLKTVTGGIE